MNKRGLSDESRLLLKGKRNSDDTDAMQQFTHGTDVGKRDFNKANDRTIKKTDLAGKDSYNSSDVENELDDIVDKRSDAALQKDFDEAFDEALSKRVKRQSDAEGRMDIKELEDDLRKEAIEMLKDPNNSIADVLDVLKRYDD